MRIPAIESAMRGEAIRRSFRVSETTISGEDIQKAQEEGFRKAMELLVEKRYEAISHFARTHLEPLIDGGPEMTDEALMEAAKAGGFRLVCAAWPNEPGKESIVLYRGSVPIAGMELILF